MRDEDRQNLKVQKPGHPIGPVLTVSTSYSSPSLVSLVLDTPIS